MIFVYLLTGCFWLFFLLMGKMLTRLAGECYAQDIFNQEMMSEVTAFFCVTAYVCFIGVFVLASAAIITFLNLVNFDPDFPLWVSLVWGFMFGSAIWACTSLIKRSAKKKYKQLQENAESHASASEYIKHMVMMMHKQEQGKDDKTLASEDEFTHLLQ